MEVLGQIHVPGHDVSFIKAENPAAKNLLRVDYPTGTPFEQYHEDLELQIGLRLWWLRFDWTGKKPEQNAEFKLLRDGRKIQAYNYGNPWFPDHLREMASILGFFSRAEEDSLHDLKYLVTPPLSKIPEINNLKPQATEIKETNQPQSPHTIFLYNRDLIPKEEEDKLTPLQVALAFCLGINPKLRDDLYDYVDPSNKEIAREVTYGFKHPIHLPITPNRFDVIFKGS